jgi:HSP20 family protein
MTLLKFRNGSGNVGFPTIERTFGFPSVLSDTLDRFWQDEDIQWMPSVNIKERDEDFRIDLAVPGMDKKDFKVELENGVLTVSGERKEEDKVENEKLTRREFHYGSFKRVFNLPESANPDQVSASYRDGILSLTVPKREEMRQKPKRQISID